MKKTVIISGGNLTESFAVSFLQEHTFSCIIGADRGIEFLKKHQIMPTHIVGDFDSSAREALAFYRQNKNIEISEFKPEKDLTDTQIAVEKAIESGSEEIWILGASGTRVDHMLANIRTLTIPARQGIPCYMIDEHNKIHITKESIIITKATQFGSYVSLFAIGGPVDGITLKGFKYPLYDYRMTGEDPIGVSNEIEADTAEILFTSGLLLVAETRD